MTINAHDTLFVWSALQLSGWVLMVALVEAVLIYSFIRNSNDLNQPKTDG